MKSKLEFRTGRNYFLGLLWFGFFILVISIIPKFFPKKTALVPNNLKFVTASSFHPEISLNNFNPNNLDQEGWEKLGFSEKQAQTILKYKNLLGGKFSSKEEIQKCFVISKEKFEELNPYIMLPETSANNRNFENQKSFYEKRTLSVSRKFNPDLYSQSDWQNLGFSEKQAAAILKYKNYLGGSFTSKELFQQCFIISDENYRKLEPFLLLPSKTPESFIKKNTHQPNSSYVKLENKKKIQYQNFDPNLLDLDGWKSLGFSEKQAQVILNYKNKNLRGSFKNLDELKNCFVISEEKFEEMKPFIKIELKTESSASIVSANPNPITTNFSKIELNSISEDELQEFGFSRKVAQNFINYRNSLGGFVNKNQIYEVYLIDRDLAEKLISKVQINTASVKKYTLMDAPESWLKTHPYFKYSADKIIYFRIDDKNEKQMWKHMNIKPEYEAKMRLYLKN